MVIINSVSRIPRAGNRLLRALHSANRLLIIAACACLLLACATHDPLPESVVAPPGREHHTVALLGATGMVGDYLLQEALASGHSVRALARSPAKLAHYGSRITVIQGDARDPDAVSELLRGSDVVVSALGPVQADGAAARTINADATRTVLQAMQAHGISRYLVVSGAAIVMPGDERDLLGVWIKALAELGLADAVRDKQAEYALLAQSTVDWTLVRCPLIDPQPFRQDVLVSLATPPAFRVRSGELARFIIDEIDARQFVREGPFVGSRQAMTPRVAGD